MQRNDKTLLQLRMAELRNTDASLSRQAQDALPILNQISSDNDLLNDLARHLNVLSKDNTWPEIPKENEIPESHFKLATICHKINKRLGTAETNQAFVERVSSCNWIMNNFVELQATINHSSLENAQKATLMLAIATAMQRMTKLPILMKDLLSDASKAVNKENPTLDLEKNALISNIKSLQRKFLRLLSMINESMNSYQGSQKSTPNFMQSFWNLFPSQPDSPGLSNSIHFKDKAASSLENSMIAPATLESIDTLAALQNSMVDDNHRIPLLEDSIQLIEEAAEEANTAIEKLAKSWAPSASFDLISDSSEEESESNSAAASTPSLMPVQKQPLIKDDKNNPLIGLLKNTNAYLTKRAKETQSFPYNIFGYGADDYHARRNHWRSTLELLKAMANPQSKIAPFNLLEAQLNLGILQFDKGRGQYARCLAGIQSQLKSFDQGSFTLMVKGAANYIERSHKAYSELDKLRQPVSDFAACSIFKPTPDQIKQDITKTLDNYADVVKLDKPIQHGGYRWDSRREFLSRDEAKKAEYNNVTSRKLV